MRHRTHKIRAVLFDFDGTLVDSTPLILRCFRATQEQVFGITTGDNAATCGRDRPYAARAEGPWVSDGSGEVEETPGS